ncbi:MAG: AMP-binding protein [Pseudomonadota bacterium]
MLNLAGAAGEPLVWRGSAPAARAELHAVATGIAGRLPARAYLVNLCESREAFLIVFMASLLAGQIQLMPGTKTPAALDDLAARFPDSHRVTDADVAHWRGELKAPSPLAACSTAASPSAETRHIFTGFTSGSTGELQAHDKYWRGLKASYTMNSAAIRAAIGVAPHAHASIVGTVPSHHMYGIELTTLLPLFAGMSVHAERPLFPADVAKALGELPHPRVLVSTPLHLRALAESAVKFPPIALVVSATAPLDAELARRVENRLECPLLEIFGSTETCAIATRRTARTPEWTTYDGVAIEAGTDHARVNAAWFPREQILNDVLELRGAGTFVLRGRNSDIVEVGGKRASLADITRRICLVPGVEDAVAFQPETSAGSANRVTALVVSSGVTGRQIVEVLAAGLDAVFLPRPLLLVDRIPRDALGKVPRAGLLELARSVGRVQAVELHQEIRPADVT